MTRRHRFVQLNARLLLSGGERGVALPGASHFAPAAACVARAKLERPFLDGASTEPTGTTVAKSVGVRKKAIGCSVREGVEHGKT
jgi:hypothetical protein